jgi:hypothetical protein
VLAYARSTERFLELHPECQKRAFHFTNACIGNPLWQQMFRFDEAFALDASTDGFVTDV